MPPRQLQEVVGLEERIVELDEGERLLAFEAQAHRVLRQHAVDREMAADVAQEGDIAEAVEPIGVVGLDRVALALAEGEEAIEGAADAAHIGGDGGLIEQAPRLVAPRRVADLGRAAAHQHDRPVPGLLQPAQRHDLHEVADMEAVGGAVEADIGRDPPRRRERVQGIEIGALMEKAARNEGVEEGRTGRRHDRTGARAAALAAGRPV